MNSLFLDHLHKKESGSDFKNEKMPKYNKLSNATKRDTQNTEHQRWLKPIIL